MTGFSVRDLTLGYGGQPAVADLCGTFAPGIATAVVGPNGSGKSTLLKAIAGGVSPLSGAIDLNGLSTRQIAYLPQESCVDRDFPIDVEDLVALGFERRLGLFRGLAGTDRRVLAEAISTAGLAGLERRPINALSGGQFQRALFARVLAEDAPLILLDEPFTSQDERTTADLVAVIRRWVRASHTLVIVLHDLEMARSLCDETLVLARRCVAWGPTRTTLTGAVLQRAHKMAQGWTSEGAA